MLDQDVILWLDMLPSGDKLTLFKRLSEECPGVEEALLKAYQAAHPVPPSDTFQPLRSISPPPNDF